MRQMTRFMTGASSITSTRDGFPLGSGGRPLSRALMVANELRHAARGYRAAHVKTLSHVAADFYEAAEGRFSFDAFGYTLQSEFPCQVDDDLDDDLAAAVVHHLHDKGAIDLQL